MTRQLNNLEQIPQPLQHEPEALVMDIYPIPGTETAPDYRSEDYMRQYLLERMEPDRESQTRWVLEATGRSWPGIQRVPTGYKEVTRLRTADEWLVSPRTAAAVVLGSALLFNTVGNHDTIADSAKWLGHKVYRAIEPVRDTTETLTHTETVPGKVVDLQEQADVATTDVSGSKITLNSQEIQSLGQKVKVLKSQGGKVLSIEVIGDTSNDWGSKGDAAFGHPNVENQVLGVQVANRAYETVEPEIVAAGLTDVPVSFDQHEAVLPQDVASSMIDEAKADGYVSLEAAVKAVDHGQLKQGNLYQRIVKYLISKRGETLDVKVEMPGQSSTHVTRETKIVPGVDHSPNVPKPGWKWFIPMLPIRRRERYQTMKETHRLQFMPSTEIMKPKLIQEEADKAWLRIRPEAVNNDGTLVKDSWAYTRKYEHLMRDGRISEVLRGDYKDAKGLDKSLRIMFVDHTPAEETVEAFSHLLTKFAAMEGGKMADRVSAMFVYPSENAGAEHGEAKRIAMGIDKQSTADVIGTYTYILDLIELHMPGKLKGEQLEELLASFDGPNWTLAHEAAGHSTDDSDAELRLRRVLARDIPNAHIIDGDPRAQKMRPLRNLLQKLTQRHSPKEEPVMFDITYPVPDKNNQIVTISARVPEGDPRLAHAITSTIVGRQVTRYAGQNDAEHYAETAAATTTGIAVPYGEASVLVPVLTADNGKQAAFATGYHPDSRAQELFTRSVGAEPGSLPVSFRNPPKVAISRTSAEDDDLLRKQMIRSRQSAVLSEREMVAILARSTRRQRA